MKDNFLTEFPWFKKEKQSAVSGLDTKDQETLATRNAIFTLRRLTVVFEFVF
jgi:hypothetical protein